MILRFERNITIILIIFFAFIRSYDCKCPTALLGDNPFCTCSDLSNKTMAVRCERARSLYDVLPALEPLRDEGIIDTFVLAGIDILWLPTKIFDGFRIKNLHMNDNLLTSIATDAFDETLADFLTSLDLKENQIDKVHQIGLEGLTNLEKLSLQKNFIMDLPLDSFSLYKSRDRIVKLDLSHNLLNDTGIVHGQGLADLSNLEELSLEANGLTAVPLAGLTELQKLRLMYLNLGLNSISHVSRGELDFLNLRSLSLEYNNITFLPLNVFGNLPNLQFLFLSGNYMTYINPQILSNVQNLLVLSLSENPIRSLRQGTFRYTRKLQRLGLSRCRIEVIENRAFAEVPGIEAIILNGNRLTSVGSDIFRGLSQLQTLDLKNNAIESVDSSAFSNLPSLRNLDLSGNKITTLSAMVFRNTFLPKLQTLFLCENPWTCDDKLLWLRKFLRYHSNTRIETPPTCLAQCQSTNEKLILDSD